MKKLLLISLTTLLTNNINAQCLPAITNETVSVSQSTICSGKTATVTIGASLPGVKYSLRDDATNAVVAGPTNGTGAALSFNTGTLTTSTTFNVYAETQPGGNVALDFDGGDDIINTNTFSSATSSLTLEAWIFPRATAYRRILSNYYQYNQTALGQFVFDTYNPNNNGRGLRFVTVGGTGTTFSVTASNVLTLNSWNHVAGTFANGVMKIYVNGLAVATSTAPFTSLPANTNEITLGMDPYNYAVASFFDGKMDDIRIWNTARTATEISTNMANCLVGNEIGLKNYFKLFENNGTTILDIVTNSVGTMSGMTSSAWTTGNVNCGTATCNFEMTDLKTVTVNTLPTIIASTSNTTICTGETATLTANGASTYTWNPGGTGTSISASPTITTTYTVIGTDANGCQNNSVLTQSVNLCTGINQITINNNGMTLFPNPSSSKVTIQTIEDLKEVFIFNTLGDLVQTEKTNTFSVEKLSSGIYIIHVKTEKGMNTIRFVKE